MIPISAFAGFKCWSGKVILLTLNGSILAWQVDREGGQGYTENSPAAEIKRGEKCNWTNTVLR